MNWNRDITAQVHLLPRQTIGLVLSVLSILAWSTCNQKLVFDVEHTSDWILLVLFGSLILPRSLTWLLYLGWGVFFGGLAIEIAFGVEVNGIHMFSYGIYGVVPFSIASIALLVAFFKSIVDLKRGT